MVGITDMNGKLLKHYAQDTVTRKRYVIIALCNENDPNTCSVVDIDELDSNIRAELVALVNSSECQSVEEIWPVLDRKYFLDYPTATMLKVLRAMRAISVVKSDQVAIQLPGEQTMTPRQVADAIKAYKAKKSGKVEEMYQPEISEVKVEEPFSPVPTAKDELAEKVTSLETKVDALVSSLSALTAALSEQKVAPKKK